MKNIVSKLLLIFSLGAAGIVNSQTEVCFNSTVDVIVKEGEDDKRKRVKSKDNCFNFMDDGSLVMTDHRGRDKNIEVIKYQLISVKDGYAYLTKVKIDDEEIDMIIDYNLAYIGILQEKRNKIKIRWYFTSE